MNKRTFQFNTETKSEELIDPVKYFQEMGKLTERNIQKAIELDATQLLYTFHDYCRCTPFQDGKSHLFEEWYKEIKK